MTHTEISLLLSGIAIGVDLAVAIHFGLQILDNRRDRKRLAEAQEKAGRPDVVDIYTDPALIGTERRP